MSGEGRTQDGSRLRASGKWGGEVGGGTGEKSRKNWKCLLWRGRGGDSEPPEWDLAGVRLHPTGKASVPGPSPAGPPGAEGCRQLRTF